MRTQEFSEDGYLIGPYGEELGYCNSCGEERAVTEDCCEDGEIDPPLPVCQGSDLPQTSVTL